MLIIQLILLPTSPFTCNLVISFLVNHVGFIIRISGSFNDSALLSGYLLYLVLKHRMLICINLSFLDNLIPPSPRIMTLFYQFYL
jgi:hypothetical protein